MGQLSDNPFWDYSLAHYSRPEVASVCLELQDNADANVNLVLLCCWLGSIGEVLSAEDLDEAEEVIRDWNEQVVKPLRQIRRFLQSESASGADRERLFEVKQLELKAEWVVQSKLFDWWQEKDDTLVDRSAAAGPDGKRQQKNLNLYLSRINGKPVNSGSPLIWPVAPAKIKN